MAINTSVDSVGTGQQGAGAPAGTTKDIKVRLNDRPETPAEKLDDIADRAAKKGFEREQRDDSTVFSK